MAEPTPAQKVPVAVSVSAPSHTDLMVPPESIDAFMEANPLPPDQEEKTT